MGIEPMIHPLKKVVTLVVCLHDTRLQRQLDIIKCSIQSKSIFAKCLERKIKIDHFVHIILVKTG